MKWIENNKKQSFRESAEIGGQMSVAKFSSDNVLGCEIPIREWADDVG